MRRRQLSEEIDDFDEKHESSVSGPLEAEC